RCPVKAWVLLEGDYEGVLYNVNHNSRPRIRGVKWWHSTAFAESTGWSWTSAAPMVSPIHFSDHRIPNWSFSTWRAPIPIGPVEPTVGRPGRHPAKTDQNRLRYVKQLLVNAAMIKRFEKPPPQVGRDTALTQVINDAWRESHGSASLPPRRRRGLSPS